MNTEHLDLLIIQHEDITPPGTSLDWAIKHNLKFEIWKIAEDPHRFRAAQTRAVIICGGTMDTHEEQKFPWLRIEKDFIQECLALKKPVFGLCLGSQLLAEALGAKVYSLNQWEVGFIPVTLLDAPFRGSQQLQVFHFHQYTFDLPLGAKLLATNSLCPHQAFTWGDHIVATQFHPEATEEWIQQCTENLDQHHYEGSVQGQQEILEKIYLKKSLQEWFFERLDHWMIHWPSFMR